MVIADLNRDDKRERRAQQLERKGRASWSNLKWNYGTAATGLESKPAASAALSALSTFRSEMEKSRSERLFRPKTVHAARHRHVVLQELEARDQLARSANKLIPKITDDAYLRISTKTPRANSSMSSSRPSTSSQSSKRSLLRASSAPHLTHDLLPVHELLKLRDGLDIFEKRTASRRPTGPAEYAKPRQVEHAKLPAQSPPGAENGPDADAALYRDLLKLRDAVLDNTGGEATSSKTPHLRNAVHVAEDGRKRHRHQAKDKSPAVVYLGTADEPKPAASPSDLAASREARLHAETVSEVHKRLRDDLDWLARAVRRATKD